MSADDSLPGDLQRDIRAARKFSLSEAIGREGGSFLKGSQAMIPRPLRALAAINGFLEQSLDDASGALLPCVKRWVKTDVRISQYLDQPLVALEVILADIVQYPELLYELSRQVAIEWGHINGERPYFQAPGAAAHPQAVYSHDSIRESLQTLLAQLAKQPDERA